MRNEKLEELSKGTIELLYKANTFFKEDLLFYIQLKRQKKYFSDPNIFNFFNYNEKVQIQGFLNKEDQGVKWILREKLVDDLLDCAVYWFEFLQENNTNLKYLSNFDICEWMIHFNDIYTPELTVKNLKTTIESSYFLYYSGQFILGINIEKPYIDNEEGLYITSNLHLPSIFLSMQLKKNIEEVVHRKVALPIPHSLYILNFESKKTISTDEALKDDILKPSLHVIKQQQHDFNLFLPIIMKMGALESYSVKFFPAETPASHNVKVYLNNRSQYYKSFNPLDRPAIPLTHEDINKIRTFISLYSKLNTHEKSKLTLALKYIKSSFSKTLMHEPCEKCMNLATALEILMLPRDCNAEKKAEMIAENILTFFRQNEKLSNTQSKKNKARIIHLYNMRNNAIHRGYVELEKNKQLLNPAHHELTKEFEKINNLVLKLIEKILRNGHLYSEQSTQSEH